MYVCRMLTKTLNMTIKSFTLTCMLFFPFPYNIIYIYLSLYTFGIEIPTNLSSIYRFVYISPICTANVYLPFMLNELNYYYIHVTRFKNRSPYTRHMRIQHFTNVLYNAHYSYIHILGEFSMYIPSAFSTNVEPAHLCIFVNLIYMNKSTRCAYVHLYLLSNIYMCIMNRLKIHIWVRKSGDNQCYRINVEHWVVRLFICI